METAEQILSELEDLYNIIIKTQENFKKCPKARLTKGYLEAKIQCIDEYWVSFKNAHRSLLKVVTKDKRKQFDYFTKNEYSLCEETFMQIKADIKDLLTSTPVQAKMADDSISSYQNVQAPQVKLPRIQLPSFTGNYEDWPTFQDLFISLVHQNTTLSSVQKLHYLKSSVAGEAEVLLKHVQITEENYTQAWEILKGRYSNKRLIVTSLLKRMFNQRKLQNQTANHIKSLHDVTTECLNSLKNLGIKTDYWDPLIVFVVVQKMDIETHKEWEQYVSKRDSDTLPTISSLMKFLETRFRMLELVAPSPSREKIVVRERSLHISTTEKTCSMCKGNHTLCHCKDFGKMEPTQRSEFVKTKYMCFNCLVPGHSVKSCRLSTTCRICRKRHHTLLHMSKSSACNQGSSSREPNQEASHTAVEDKEEVKTSVNTVMTSQSHNICKGNSKKIALLATAVVSVRSDDGHTTVLRALIDPGSESCFITERAAQTLQLKRQPVKGSILGMGSMKSKIKQVVQVEVSSRCSQFNLQIEAYVISKQLTTEIPKTTITAHDWPHITGLSLADPNYYTPGTIDLLLGHDEYAQILQHGLIKGPPGSPCAQKTSLGWILFGKIEDHSQHEQSVIVMHNQIEIDDMLKVLWEIDTNTNRKLTKEEETCEKLYEETYRRNEEGRYVVKLPFKTNYPKSVEGNTRSIALRRLEILERKLNNNPELKTAYTEVMEEYIKMGHMEEVPRKEMHNDSVYLPHHAVVRSEKETTKTRIVFDASCKGVNGVSLNNELLIGPVLQEDLRSIIMRCRLHKVCFASDIEKMYRMVMVTKDSSDFQRVLWRQNTSTFDEVKDFRLLTVTFGTASAPYLAIKTLIQLAHDEGKSYPVASRMIKEDFYVDDLISGCDTVMEAIEVSKQIQIILSKGKFNLKKWTSNNIEFLRSIEPDDRSAKASVDLKMDSTVKALGLSWNLGSDEFQYNLSLPPLPNHITKRTVLADLQRLFDPLGWIAPAVVRAKIFVQKLWLRGVGWDEHVNELEKHWIDIREDLNNVNSIKVTRWLNTFSKTPENITLHGFSDASMHAMSAVVYCRVIDSNGSIKTSIVAARTKVAPVKTISIPRLELCGAVLLSKLLHQAAQAMRIPSNQVYAWTDSSIVLSWLFGEPNRWKPFVANRVVEILENVNNSQWNHVQSEDNPADVASRGTSVSELQGNLLWWYGPKFLTKKCMELKRPNVSQTDLEKRQTRILVNTVHEVQDTEILNFENFDKLQELQKVIVYCKRFLNYKKTENSSKEITVEEFDIALKICIRKAQKQSFTKEIESIRRNKQVKQDSHLKSLNPFIDEDHILRVGGRLRHANISHENKHPIIMDSKHALATLIIADAHQKTLHGGLQLMLCYLRTKFWIIRAKRAVKLHIHKCLVCARVSAKSRTQIMGDLPRVRVTPSRPFLHSGVDFAGPYTVLLCKGRGGKTTKAYISIFICMCTKAIHLELVGDLSSEAFIGAFRRFIARRGRCIHLWSDQGRNFIGANKELAEAWSAAKLEFTGQIAESLAQEGTQWHFIPPYSPNFGGLWEAGVKSLKYHMKRILTTNLTYEEMTTLLCEIESCLNSRPLCLIDDNDVDNINPLTAGHFLIGEAPTAVPAPDIRHVNINHLTRWKYTQRLLRDFWQRWQHEYLSRLQQRPKWLKHRKEFQVNDIVLIKQDNLPPGKWLLGRITEKHPGPDNVTRVYSVKSGDTVTKRCVSKLCFLPVND